MKLANYNQWHVPPSLSKWSVSRVWFNWLCIYTIHMEQEIVCTISGIWLEISYSHTLPLLGMELNLDGIMQSGQIETPLRTCLDLF
jgi:hypothetical protein